MPSLKHQLLAAHNAVHKFSEWNFSGEVPVERRDEAGALAWTLNRLAKFYGQIAPLSHKTFALQAGKTPSINTNTNTDINTDINQNKEAVVLFCNIRSFSTVTRDLRPREKLDLVNGFFQRIGVCARLTGGHIDKYLGDKAIVHWGILDGGTTRDNALAAIRAVLMMRAYLGDWNQKRINAGLPPLLFSFGVDVGRASLSPFFVGGACEYGLTGPAVNKACHCEAATKPAQAETFLSENVYHLVERFVVAGEITQDPPGDSRTKPAPRFFPLINIQGKKLTRHLAKDLARIADIDLPLALTFAGPRGPRTLSELRTMLHHLPTT